MLRVSSGEFGPILAGGLVTRLTKHFEIDLKNFPIVKGDDTIGISLLK